jgi:hypothetical protein
LHRCGSPRLLHSVYSAYLWAIKRADERNRTADLISLRVRGQWLLSVAGIWKHYLVLQCHFDLGYESATSPSESEHLHYPLPETFLAPLAVVAVDRAPRPELLFR